MDHMNKFTVWTSKGTGDFIPANEAIVVGDTVSFRVDGREVKRYDKKEFFKYNPQWKLLENTE